MFRTHFLMIPAIALCAATVACGSSDDGSDPNTDDPPMNPDDPPMNPDDPPMNPDDPPEIQWDPGTADPCENFETDYLNDELCLKPPPEDIGFQTHFGPTDYDNPDDVNRFLLAPGDENVVCQFRFTPNFEGERYSNEQHTRLRSGTHHMIMWTATSDLPNAPADGTFSADGCQNPFEYMFSTGSQSAIGEEGGRLDIPIGGVESPENVGTAKLVAPNRSIAMEMHYVNTTEESLLREGWTNTIYADPSTVTTKIDAMFLIGLNINVPVGGEQLVQVTADQPTMPPDSIEPKVRILGLTGHAHANTQRFSVYIDRAATGQKELIYETFDWSEPLNAQFSTQHTNPPPGDGINDGAHTGMLTMDPGDKLSWECHIVNQQDVVLRFGNQAYTSEMCNVFGFVVPGWGGMWAHLY